MSSRCFSVLFSCLFTLFVIPKSDSWAVSFEDAFQVRPGYPIADINANSYDGTAFDAFSPLVPYTTGQIFQMSSFTAEPGQVLTFFVLTRAGFFDGRHAGYPGNIIGLVDSLNNFTMALPPDALPGDSGAVAPLEGEEYRLALNSPEGLFTTIDSENPDGDAHVLSMLISKPGIVFFPNATLLGDMLLFEVLIGDRIFAWEDLKRSGNQHLDLPADFDYNDYVVLVRSSAAAVPEPTALLLLGPGLVLARRWRAKR